MALEIRAAIILNSAKDQYNNIFNIGSVSKNNYVSLFVYRTPKDLFDGCMKKLTDSSIYGEWLSLLIRVEFNFPRQDSLQFTRIQALSVETDFINVGFSNSLDYLDSLIGSLFDYSANIYSKLEDKVNVSIE